MPVIDHTPGAREAHVVRFIDNALATFLKHRRPKFDKAMSQLAAAVAKRSPGTKAFAALNEAGRIAVVTELEKNSAEVSTTGTPGSHRSGIMTEPDRACGAELSTSPQQQTAMRRYRPADEVDFVIVGSGAAGGVPHLLGTCRMGNDPESSVINADHRTHDVPNLFIVDGSSFVTSGRGQPTMTIQALAFRAADRITQLARTRRI